MKIGLIGYGKMGKAVEKIALERRHEIVAHLSSKNNEFTCLTKADVCIDFTTPLAVWETICRLAPLKKPLVIGTTGWESHLEKAIHLAKTVPFGLLYAPNFSIGMYVLKNLLQKSAELIKPFDFDVAGIEMHQSQKKDSPSGSALELSRLLSESLEKNVPFTSVRCGKLEGTHQVIFNSIDDTIKLTHYASSRMGFARGAVEAAEWLSGKVGHFSFDDFMKEQICNSME